jgi:hypothetical protein
MGVDWHGTWRRERNRGSQKPGGRNSSHGQSGSSRSDRLEGACSLPGSCPARKCTNSCAPLSLRVNGAAACAIPLPIIGGRQPPLANASAANAMSCKGPARPIRLRSPAPRQHRRTDREAFWSCVGHRCVGHPINSGRAAHRLLARTTREVGTRLASRAAISRMKMTREMGRRTSS